MLQIPRAFQQRGIIRRLNVAAVGLALGCGAGAVIGGMLSPSPSKTSSWSIAIAIPTIAIGAFWAAFFRPDAPPRVSSRFRMGWGWSVLLAILNAQLAALMVGWVNGTGSSGLGETMGLLASVACFGSIVWVPSVLVTFACFGAPMYYAQWLEKKGLAGQERGERIVALAAVAMAVAGLLFLHRGNDRMLTLSAWFSPMGMVGYFAIVAGATAAALSWMREKERRAFVRDVEGGRVTGFRVAPSDEGKVLMRVSSQCEGYRVSEFREEVFNLDESGEARYAYRSCRDEL